MKKVWLVTNITCSYSEVEHQSSKYVIGDEDLKTQLTIDHAEVKGNIEGCMDGKESNLIANGEFQDWDAPKEFEGDQIYGHTYIGKNSSGEVDFYKIYYSTQADDVWHQTVTYELLNSKNMKELFDRMSKDIQVDEITIDPSFENEWEEN